MLAAIAIPDFEPGAAAWLAAIRAAHDPLQDRVKPHVTLVFPTEIADEAGFMARVQESAAQTAAFDVAFDRLGRMVDAHTPKYAHLNVLLADGPSAARLEALHRRLAGSTEAYEAHVTIARFGAVYCSKALMRQIGAFGAPLRGRVAMLQVLRIDSGAIRTAAQYPLTG